MVAIDYVFSAPIATGEVPGFPNWCDVLVAHILAQYERHPGVAMSNDGGWSSPPVVDRSSDDVTRWLVGAIQDTAGCLIERIGAGDRALVKDFWANVHTNGQWRLPHSHSPNRYCGILFVQRGGSGGDVLFLNPNPAAEAHGQALIARYPCEPGVLLVFPGHLVHMVTPCFDGDRISVSFNLVVGS